MRGSYHTACHVIFCDRRVNGGVLIQRSSTISPNESVLDAVEELDAPQEVKDNIETVLKAFNQVYLCESGIACLNRLKELDEVNREGIPVVVFLDIDPRLDFGTRLSHDTSLLKPTKPGLDLGSEEYHGIKLLRHLATISFAESSRRLVIPIALIREGRRLSSQSVEESDYVNNLCESLKANVEASESLQLVEPRTLMQCLDAGATDAFNSPLDPERLQQVIVAAYKAHLQYVKGETQHLDLKRIRKRSWVGVEEERPYAYLREAMVSSLMSSICRPETASLGLDLSIEAFEFEPESKERVAAAIGSWNFSAHDFSDDELLYGAYLILSHSLKLPELEKWYIPDHALRKFLIASRAAYNNFVLYHNFRHVVDVLQALFYSLVQIGALPVYPASSDLRRITPASPVARLFRPLDSLVLLVSAIGHDVGHPRVNNRFLVTLKAPLAQLYNDKSVLEAFHCAAYSQILRRHWKPVYDDVEFRRLLINTILATDMGLHPDYMANLGNLQERLHHDGGTDGWTTKAMQANKDLVLGLLIKCADISNVARPFKTAARWAAILQQEFAKQGEMERDVGMASTLFGGPPELGNLTKLANSQIGFMNFFGLPLFEGVADLMPQLRYAVEEIMENKTVWEYKIELAKRREKNGVRKRYADEGTQSPRSASPDRANFTVTPISTHPEGLPASKLTTTIFTMPDDDPSNSLTALRRKSLPEVEDFFTPPISPPSTSALQSSNDDVQSLDSRLKSSSSPSFSILRSNGSAYAASAARTSADPTEGQILDSNLTESSTLQATLVDLSHGNKPSDSRSHCHQHPTHPSHSGIRSTASSIPGFASSKYPISPTETRDVQVSPDSDNSSSVFRKEQVRRPYTGDVGLEVTNTNSGIPSRTSRASISGVSDSPIGEYQNKTRPVTSGMPITRAGDGHRNEYFQTAQVKRKSSRWKFDFWRRKKQGEKEVEAFVDSRAILQAEPP